MERELLDPGTPVRSERASVRREVLQMLRYVIGALRTLVSHWDVGRQYWDGAERYASERLRDDGKPWSQPWRWRLWGEYRENDPGRMRQDARTLRELSNDLLALAERLDYEATKAQQADAERRRAAEAQPLASPE